jgi:hypothetical protein
VYSISLFLHIVGALGLFAVLSLEWASLYHLRRATDAGEIREGVGPLRAPRIVGGPAALTLLVTGIHLTATHWGLQGWIVVGLAGMALVLGMAAGLPAWRSGRQSARMAASER